MKMNPTLCGPSKCLTVRSLLVLLLVGFSLSLPFVIACAWYRGLVLVGQLSDTPTLTNIKPEYRGIFNNEETRTSLESILDFVKVNTDTRSTSWAKAADAERFIKLFSQSMNEEVEEAIGDLVEEVVEQADDRGVNYDDENTGVEENIGDFVEEVVEKADDRVVNYDDENTGVKENIGQLFEEVLEESNDRGVYYDYENAGVEETVDEIVAPITDSSAQTQKQFSTILHKLERKKNQVKHEMGKVFYSSGDTYEGELYNETPHGFGSMEYADGSFYQGYWNTGVREGPGTHWDRSGELTSKFSGVYRKDMKTYKGSIVFSNGDTYTGGWNADMYFGYGELQWNNWTYKGDLLYGLMDGEGTLYYPDGSRLDCHWVSGHPTGVCRYTETDGLCSRVEWIPEGPDIISQECHLIRISPGVQLI